MIPYQLFFILVMCVQSNALACLRMESFEIHVCTIQMQEHCLLLFARISLLGQQTKMAKCNRLYKRLPTLVGKFLLPTDCFEPFNMY